MHISLIYLVITTLIYASFINSQPYRGAGLPMDDLVAAIATAAINGAIPFNKINLRNPNRDGRPLRIPILLIKHKDLMNRQKFHAKYSNDRPNWNSKNSGDFRPHKNDRNFHKQDYFPKPKFPTHGLKVVPAPKLLHEQQPLPKLNNRPSVKLIQLNDRNREREPKELPERYPERYNERQNERQHERQHERQNERQNERYNLKQNERFPERQNERLPERQIERYPVRQNERLPERQNERLPEREYGREPERPQFDEQEDYDERPVDLPQSKPAIRTPTVIRHVYGSHEPNSDTAKPTIPPRYLKDMPRSQSSSSSGEKYNNGLQELPPISEIFHQKEPSIRDGSDDYSSEPIVNHKFVNLGDVYRKANNEEVVYRKANTEEEVEEVPQEEGSSEDRFEGYAKDPYDKQLVNTLKNLMATSKERHPLNIGGLSEDSKEEVTYKSNTQKPIALKSKSIDSYFPKTNTEQYSSQPLSYSRDIFSQSSAQRAPQTYDSIQTTSTSQQNNQLIPQSLLQYSSQSQTSSQSRIPESILSQFSKPYTMKSFSSVLSDTSSATNKVLKSGSNSFSAQSTPDSNGVTHMVQLMPGQVPILPDLSTDRKPVSIDFDYNTASRPLSPSSYFSSDQKSDHYGQQSKTYITKTAQGLPQTNDYQASSSQQPLKTYVVTGMYRKQIGGQDKNVEQEQYDDDKEPQDSEIRESFTQAIDSLSQNNPSVKFDAPLESLKRPIYLQLGSSVFFEMGPKGNLINTSARNNRPPQKVSTNLFTKTQQLDEYKEEDIRIDDIDNDNHNNNTTITVTDFSCENRSQGYYADVQHNCQIYYQCYLGGSYKFSCPNGTRFDEQRLLCDWRENTSCGEREKKTNIK